MYYISRFMIGLVMLSEMSLGQQRSPGDLPSSTVPVAEGDQSLKPYHYPRMNGEQLVEVYAALSGRRVVLTREALSAEFCFVQTQPLSRQEALSLLKIACLVEGFVFVPTGAGLDSLIYSPPFPSTRGLNLPLLTNPEDLPAGDQVVAYVIPLRNIRPEDAKRTFESVLPQQSDSYGAIKAVSEASCVIVTDTLARIRSLIALSKKIDLPLISVATAFIKVQHSDVSELAESLNHLVGSRPREKPPQNGEGTGEGIPIQIVPNPRTNEIFVMGHPADMAFVEALIHGFDSPADQRNFLRRKLKFIPVAGFVSVARQALECASSNDSGNPTEQSASKEPLATLTNCTLVVEDRITNSIVVQGPAEGLQLINRLLEELDVKAEQIRISGVFGHLRLEDRKPSGIDYLRALNLHGGSTGGAALPPNDSTAFSPSIPAAPQSEKADGQMSFYGKIGTDLTACLQALEADGRFTVLSRPTITVANNTMGTITSSSRVVVPASDYGNESTGEVTTNSESCDADFRLEVVPLVNSAAEVTLQIHFVCRDQGDILNRELITTVTVPNHEVIVLGGSIPHREGLAIREIPFLTPKSDDGTIAGAGSPKADRDELLVFIQPQIGGDKDTSSLGEADSRDRYKTGESGSEMTEEPASPSKASDEDATSRDFEKPVLPLRRDTGNPGSGGESHHRCHRSAGCR